MTEKEETEKTLQLKDFYQKNTVYLTDSSALTMLTILEFIRVFLDEEKLSWQ